MILVLAGKTNALVECLRFSLTFLNKDSIFVIPSDSDNVEDTWQYSVREYCVTNGLKITTLEDVYNIYDLIFISIQYDRIIDVNKFKSVRLYNIHFSYLPNYKGMYPVIWPILNLEKFSGVTLHELDWGIDTGDIIDQEKILLNPNIIARQLYEDCLDKAILLFKRNLSGILENSYFRKRQEFNYGSYYSKKSIDFSSLKIDFKKTAFQVSSQFRAFIFPEYQFPVFNNFEICRVEILSQRSLSKPGEIVDEKEKYFVVNTIDYNIKLFKSYSNELFKLIVSGDFHRVRKLLCFVDDIEIKNGFGWTLLMVAAFRNDLEIVKLLVENGANVNAKNFKGTSVLMYAKSAVKDSGSLEVLTYLVEHGAKVNDYDSEGVSLLFYAEKEGNPKVIEFLRSRVV